MKALEVFVEQVLKAQIESLDREWVELLSQAKELGIAAEAIRSFLTDETRALAIKK
jgi:hypothetical protein